MDKDLYIDLLENDIRRIRAGADVVHSVVEYQKLRERYSQCEMDLQNRDDEIQNLKLENDRLKRREELYQEFLDFFDCHDRICIRCSQYYPEEDVPCKLALINNRHVLINEFKQKLEDL